MHLDSKLEFLLVTYSVNDFSKQNMLKLFIFLLFGSILITNSEACGSSPPVEELPDDLFQEDFAHTITQNKRDRICHGRIEIFTSTPSSKRLNQLFI